MQVKGLLLILVAVVATYFSILQFGEAQGVSSSRFLKTKSSQATIFNDGGSVKPSDNSVDPQYFELLTNAKRLEYITK